MFNNESAKLIADDIEANYDDSGELDTNAESVWAEHLPEGIDAELVGKVEKYQADFSEAYTGVVGTAMTNRMLEDDNIGCLSETVKVPGREFGLDLIRPELVEGVKPTKAMARSALTSSVTFEFNDTHESIEESIASLWDTVETDDED